MAKFERFEDLPVWREAARLYNALLDLLETQGLVLSSGFRNQLDRAAGTDCATNERRQASLPDS